MRKTFLLALMTLCVTATSGTADDDELFSKTRLGAAAESAPKTVAAPTRPRRRVDTAAASLQTALLASGYSARTDENGNLSITVTRGDWSAPVAISPTDNGQQLRFGMQLTTVNKDSTFRAATLRDLLQANGQSETAFFALNGTPQRVELVRLVPANALDSASIQDNLEQMIDRAISTKGLWNVGGHAPNPAPTQTASTQTTQTRTAQTTPSTPAATPQTSTNPPANTASLTGRWVASPAAKEAFAIQLKVDGTFRLVHVKGTSNTQSKGNYTLDGNKLTLKGDDGTTLSGTVTRTTDGFTLAIGASGDKAFTLTFKKGTN